MLRDESKVTFKDGSNLMFRDESKVSFRDESILCFNRINHKKFKNYDKN